MVDHQVFKTFDVAHLSEKVGDPCCNGCFKSEWFSIHFVNIWTSNAYEKNYSDVFPIFFNCYTYEQFMRNFVLHFQTF